MKPPVEILPELTENELKRRVLDLAYQNGWAVYHVPQATMRNGGGSGYPDLTCARDGEVIWLELKRQDGNLTHQQAAWVAILPAAHVVRPSDWWNGRIAELLA